jgi:hypothetical protein
VAPQVTPVYLAVSGFPVVGMLAGSCFHAFLLSGVAANTHRTENAHTHTYRTHPHAQKTRKYSHTNTEPHMTHRTTQNTYTHCPTTTDQCPLSSHDLAWPSRLLSSLLSRLVNLLSLPTNILHWFRAASMLRRNCQPGVDLRDLSLFSLAESSWQ